tara:strand:+ start:1916 stop:2308 length:393 start_codon:yes stop_codon:yes gene_type:complete
MNNSTKQLVCVGTDSQIKGMRITFTTAVVLLNVGRGGICYYKRDIVHDKRDEYSLRRRLLTEVWKSVEVAMQLDVLDCPLQIHIDANPNLRFKSNRYIRELVAMVAGQGYDYRTKPYAWAAQTVADKLTR